MTPKITRGIRLRRDLDAALAAAGNAMNQADLEWDEADRIAIDRAAEAADRAEQLRTRYDLELAGEASPNALVRLSSEIRALDRLVLEVVRRLNGDLKRMQAGLNVRKQRAANYRWSRQQRPTAGGE